jgi:putative transposase
MGIKRYELDDAQWLRIALLLPGKARDPGRTGSDNRLFVNGCLWVLRSGAHWRDLPERYGKWKTVHRRFSRWCHAGVWERVFEALTADRDNKYLMLDSTIVRAHQQAATGKGGPGSGAGAFPRWTNHQGPHALRYAWPSLAVSDHAGPSQ